MNRANVNRETVTAANFILGDPVRLIIAFLPCGLFQRLFLRFRSVRQSCQGCRSELSRRLRSPALGRHLEVIVPDEPRRRAPVWPPWFAKGDQLVARRALVTAEQP